MLFCDISNLIMAATVVLYQIYNTQYAVPMPQVPCEVLKALLPHYTDTAYFGTFEDRTFGHVER